MSTPSQVYVSERQEFSALLGPDGRPLPYAKPEPVGFRLIPSIKES
jgi:hypothetical protein